MKTEEDNANRAMLEKLLVEKEKLALTLESIGDGVISVDTEERIVLMNCSAGLITGWSPELAINKPYTEVFNVVEKATGKPLDNLLPLTISSGKMTGLKKDTILISKNGEGKYVSASISPMKGSGNCTGVVIVFRDITRIRQIEQKVLTEQQNQTLIFDAAPIGMLLVDENAVVKKVNKSMLHIVGRHEQEVVNQKIGNGLGCLNSFKDENGCGFSDMCGKCELRRTLLDIIDSTETILGIETHYTLLIDDIEKELCLKINSIPITIDNKKHIVVVIDDITERKTAEEGLRRYQLLSDNANDIIMFSEINGRVTEANNAALISYGYTKEEILNKSIFDLVSPDKRSPVRTQSYKLNTEGVYYEATAKRKDGTAFFADVSLQSAEIGKSKVLLSIQRDITERKQTQKELESAREFAEAANQAKSEFLANMSHEIRTPLNGMLGMIDLTLLTGLTEEQKDNLHIAKGCASTLLNLINDILDFSRIEARRLVLEKIGFNVMDLVEQTIKTHSIKARGKGLELRYQIDPQIPSVVNGDPNRLKQILNNLLGNAVKFTDFGEIFLLVCLQNKTDNYIELKFHISDTGVGMDPKDMEWLFETFSQADSSITRKYGGSGLGLAISKRLVEMMGGSIWVESQKGKGSNFYFTVRLAAGSVKPGTKHNIEAIGKTKRPLQILLAEDDKINKIVITRMLLESGHFVETAGNGADALRIINEKDIDIVLMDIQMPEMDGIEAVRRVRLSEEGTERHIPIIALTAYALKGDREKYLSAGMDDYITKPVQVNNLLETIEEVAERSKVKKWDKTFAGKQKDFIFDNSKSVEVVINNISVNIELLKGALEKGDLPLVEKYAHETKQLSIIVSAAKLKNAIFKVELAARRENIAAAAECFQNVIMELDKFRRGS